MTIYLKVGGTFGGSANLTISENNKEFRDFNGDGYADYIEKDGTNLRVSYSRIKRTNMLETVHNPIGGSFTIDYKVQPVSYDNPNAKWAMSDVLINDGYNKVNDGEDLYKKHYTYENGRYDRREREFYGYKTVKEEDYTTDSSGNPTIYRTSVSNYHNRSYFLNGLLEDSYVMKGSDVNKKFSRTRNFYEIRQLDNITNNEISSIVLPDNFDVGGTEGRKTAAVLLTKTINELYEQNSNPLITSRVEMTYDNKGRVITFNNIGDIATPNDNYSSTITYHDDPNLLAQNIISIPKSIIVQTSSGTVRERETDVNTSNGSIELIRANNNGAWAETNMKYDQYGNLIHIEHPENTAHERMTYDYEYETAYNKYVASITNSFGYVSTANYDSNFDKILETVDMAGNHMQYSYDSFGRNTLIIAPKEIEAGKKYTIKFDYYPYFSLLPSGTNVTANTFVPVAVTSHYDQQHPDNDIETYTFIDGMARPIQVKKDIQINKGGPRDPNYIEALSVSGKTYYDELGRTIKQFHPWWEPKDNTTKFLLNEYASLINPTLTDYDELDRPIKTTDPASSISTMEYSLGNDHSGAMAIKTKSDVDQNGAQHVVTETYKNVAGKVISTMNVGGITGTIWTKFDYDPIGQLLQYTDADGKVTKYNYDMFGRKISVDNPDNGLTTFTYDNINLTSLQTANLANAGTTINYQYNANRLEHILYPDDISGNPNLANVDYKYGDMGNRTGRLVWQRDATGEQEFDYGNMGEMTTNVRTVVGPNIPTRIFKTNFEYDSWNRLQAMQYPDGEKVTYGYDLGGNLNSMVGEYNSNPYKYIQRIDYDYYEQRSYLLYGNKTETFYNYSSDLRRLDNLNVKTSNGNDLFNNKYNYDKIGNVLDIENSAGINNHMAGRYKHSFSYDNLNRLVTAGGTFDGDLSQTVNGQDANASYELEMKYNDTHGIVTKHQYHDKNGNTFMPNTYSNTYDYVAGTHQVEKITDGGTGDVENFKYDADGNIVMRETPTQHRDFSWDESNRLRVVADSLSMQHYIYDAGGERVLKASSDTESIYENGTLVDPSSILINGYISYPSAFMVVNGDGVYSKHYYAGSQRIVSRLGDHDASIFELPCAGCSKNSNNNFDAAKLQQAQKDDLQNYAKKAKKGKVQFKEYKPIPLEEQEKALAEENNPAPLEGLGEAKPLPPVLRPPPIYYYHPDHLGTSTALTDFNGKAYQFFLNLPFGETMAEQLGQNYYNTPYKFNGKELDDETGFYYYGARYYDPRVSIWLSTDPLAEKYPNESPYIYCGNNPINMIDPDGRFKIPIHLSILKDAFNSSGLNKGWNNSFMNDVMLGISLEADVLGVASDYHFDGRKDYIQVQMTWFDLNAEISNKINDLGSFNRAMGGDDAILFGRMIHTVQDFYSHSNYVELYIEYYKGGHLGDMPESVPIYDAKKGGTKDDTFNSILQKRLRTGEFDTIDNEFTNKNGKKANDPSSHNKMNKDKANTPAGRLAKKVATEHTRQILEQTKKSE